MLLVWDSCQIVVPKGWTGLAAGLRTEGPVSPHPFQEVGYRTLILGENDISVFLTYCE